MPQACSSLSLPAARLSACGAHLILELTGQKFRPNAPRSEVGRRALPSLERNCNFAARAVRCEDQVNGAAEFMRNKIEDEA